MQSETSGKTVSQNEAQNDADSEQLNKVHEIYVYLESRRNAGVS